ncbi:MAG: serine hydrolase [Opitutaceae bacterium]
MRILPALCAFVLAASPLSLSQAFAAMPPLKETDLALPFAALLENKTLQAVSVAVIQPGGTTTAHLGLLAPNRAVAPDDHTLYEIGSISKVFTSLLLAEAVVRGELTLDTPVADLLPSDVNLPNSAAQRITVRMLATHTSGLPSLPPEIPPDNFANPYARYAEADLWQTLRQVKLDFEPGTSAAYSNLAAGLLGTLLARRAHTTYAELLAARITKPLGMEETMIAIPETLRPRFAPPFTSAGELWTPWEFQALAGAGGIRSSLADMKRFAAAILRPADTPLQKAIELSWTRQELAKTFAPGGQALGWMLAGDGRTRWHNGMTGGFHAALFVNRELGLASVLLSNRSTPIGTELAAGLMQKAAGLPERPIPNRDRAEIAVTTEQLDRCVGTFQVTPQFSLVCERRNQALFVTPTGQSTDRLYAASPTTFFSRRAPADLAFDLPAEGGPATAVILKQAGRELRGTRQ